MDDLSDLVEGMLSGLGYCAIGLVLLAVGYKVLDALLPGDLSTQIYTERNTNAALVVAAGLIALGTIVTTAIVTSARRDRPGRGRRRRLRPAGRGPAGADLRDHGPAHARRPGCHVHRRRNGTRRSTSPWPPS